MPEADPMVCEGLLIRGAVASDCAEILAPIRELTGYQQPGDLVVAAGAPLPQPLCGATQFL